ncbi:c-type cytochrome [Daejeonella sp.]|uniref:c-type cytochrome n=1 Tax=Daejeonella sp. TaxID=2805397 RepID=UPI0025C3721E|nr:c-type cytochrome [Daejeonella sp.]
MKRILLMGLATLLFACNSSTEKTNTSSDSTVLKAADTTEISASPDTSNTTQLQDATTDNKATEVKASTVEENKKPLAKEIKDVPQIKAVENSDLENIKNGEVLISKSDCFACHKVQDKVLGPSYKDIANKYAKNKANIDYLINKVKVGGSGVWGAVPMSPHPNLSDDDARDMILYILSLK